MKERVFLLHWKSDPKPQEIKGKGADREEALVNACNSAGIGRGAMRALDYWEEVKEPSTT